MASSPGAYKGVDIAAGSQEQIMAQMANIDAGTQVSASTLAPTNSISIPPSQPQTDSSSFGSYLEGLSKNTTTAKAKKESSFTDLLSSLTNSSTEGDLTNQAYGMKGGVDDTEMELNDINAQLLGEQEGLRRTVEEIQNNEGGLYGATRGAIAGRIDEARRKSLRTQADLAVVQMAKQGRYDSAKKIADRAITAQLEKQRQQNELRQLLYSENKDDFTKAEQREFETNQKERERTLQNEEYRMRAEFDQKIRQNDPQYQLQLQQLRIQNQKIQQEIGTNYNLQMSQQEFDTLPSADKNNTSLLQLFSSGKVSAGNKTVIGASLQLARAAQDLAGANPNGQFEGLYPFRGVVDFFLPEGLKRPATVRNDAQINAINLQTQFWASGAALTDAQTKLVMDMVPTKNDTDNQVKNKLNSLVNYMMSQTAARLQTDGVNFKPEQVNLFEAQDLLSQASPEQIKQLQEAGAL